MESRFSRFKPRLRPPTPARVPATQATDFLRKYADAGEASLAEPFKGITTNGAVVPGLFRIGKTGVSTEPIKDAAEAFLTSLTPAQKARALFPVDSDAWRRAFIRGVSE